MDRLVEIVKAKEEFNKEDKWVGASKANMDDEVEGKRYRDGINEVDYKEDEYVSGQHQSEHLGMDDDLKDDKDMSQVEVYSSDPNLV